MAHKRDAAMLMRLLETFGDVPLSEAIKRLKAPPRKKGRPKTWDDFLEKEVFLGVEAFKDTGLSTRQAWKAAAEYMRTTPNKVAKAYVKGRRIMGAAEFQEWRHQILHGHMSDRPRLRRLCNVPPNILQSNL